MNQEDLYSRGKVIEMDGPRYIAVFVKDPVSDGIMEGFLIATYIKASVLAVTEQINAHNHLYNVMTMDDSPEGGTHFGCSRD